ncbi:MAG: hypothetical protein H3C35_03565 [Bacteroidetes bacterium]|nr:hypothetical protein [Bacteroidota bacterium]
MKNIECEYDNGAQFPVPIVVRSDLETFPKGTPIDIGKMILLLKKGCSILITPKGKANEMR